MTTPPAIHLLAATADFQRAWCGLVLVDPQHERIVTDRARVTCRQCRRLAHMDSQPRPVAWPGKEQGE